MLAKIFKNELNKITLIYFIFYLPIFFGLLPRQFIYLALSFLVYKIFTKNSHFNLLLFLRLIPFFIALPLTQNFDNFNIWRILIILIFIKWFFENNFHKKIFNILNKKFNLKFLQANILEITFILFIFWSIFSLFNGVYLFEGFKRIIYLANISLLFPLVYYFVKKNINFLKRISASLIISGGLILFFAFFQQILAFSIPIEVFQHFWGETVSLNLYGKNWSNIVMNFGNTWYSYPQDSTPRLRIFSVFPDSHTSPMYLLMIIPFFIYLYFNNYFSYKKLIFLLFFSFMILASGTRGIWISILFPVLFWLLLSIKTRVLIFAKLNFSLIAIFIFSFAILYIIYSVPQFLKFNEGFKKEVLSERLASVVSLEERSNIGRIFIWGETLKSIIKNPIFGVGLGNFPIVLKEPISYAKAGSSAHNLYLNFLAETGLIGGFLFLIILLEILRRAYLVYLKSKNFNLKIFSYSFIFFILWIYGYSLTDAALLDERTMLLFTANLGLISGLYHKLNLKSKRQGIYE